MRVPFVHFFQGITVQAFISVAIGSAWGGAVLHVLFSRLMVKNYMLVSSAVDGVNHQIGDLSNLASVGQFVQIQSLMITFKELYGVLIIVGLGFLLLFFLYRYLALPYGLYPKMSIIKQVVKSQIPRRFREKV